MAAYSYSKTTTSARKGGGYGPAIAAVKGSATQEVQDAKARYGSLAAGEIQGLVNSGLYNSMNRTSVGLGVQRQLEGALGSINDRMNANLAGLYAQQAQAGQQDYWNSIQSAMEAQRLAMQRSQMNSQQQGPAYVRPRNGARMVESSYINPGSMGAYQNRYSRI